MYVVVVRPVLEVDVLTVLPPLWLFITIDFFGTPLEALPPTTFLLVRLSTTWMACFSGLTMVLVEKTMLGVSLLDGVSLVSNGLLGISCI